MIDYDITNALLVHTQTTKNKIKEERIYKNQLKVNKFNKLRKCQNYAKDLKLMLK